MSTPPDYEDLFRTQILRAARFVLEQVRAAPPPIAENTATSALHLLPYLFDLDGAWPLARDLLLALAPLLEQAGYRDEWVPYLTRGVRKSQDSEDNEAEAALRFHLGVLQQLLGRWSDAHTSFEHSAALYKRLPGRTVEQARALNRLAYVCRLAHHLDDAAAYVAQAQALAVDDPREAGYSQFVRGSIAYDQRDWAQAHHHFQQSISQWDLAGDERLIAWAAVNLGLVLSYLKRYEETIKLLERAIALLDGIDPLHQAAARMNLGIAYYRTERFDEALRLYEQARSAFHHMHDRLRLAMLYNNEGMAYQALQQWDRAAMAYRASISRWRELDNVAGLVNVLDNLGLLHLAQGQHDEARAVFHEALHELARIEGQGGHDYLLRMVTDHLADVDAADAGGE